MFCGLSSVICGSSTLLDSTAILSTGSGNGSSPIIVSVSSAVVSSMYISSVDISASSIGCGSTGVCTTAHPDIMNTMKLSINTAVTSFFMTFASLPLSTKSVLSLEDKFKCAISHCYLYFRLFRKYRNMPEPSTNTTSAIAIIVFMSIGLMPPFRVFGEIYRASPARLLSLWRRSSKALTMVSSIF